MDEFGAVNPLNLMTGRVITLLQWQCWQCDGWKQILLRKPGGCLAMQTICGKSTQYNKLFRHRDTPHPRCNDWHNPDPKQRGHRVAFQWYDSILVLYCDALRMSWCTECTYQNATTVSQEKTTLGYMPIMQSSYSDLDTFGVTQRVLHVAKSMDQEHVILTANEALD